IIGDRSYGSDPEEVSGLGAARIHGLQGHGIAACAKHFPGLGCVPKDPHRVLPTIETSWEEMEEIHLAPFQKAIEEKVAMVMSSHVCYPGLGEPGNLPATFSRHLIHGLLRERFHFNGLILTDDLEMGALRQLGSMGELAIRATEAGHDLLLICSDLDAACQAAEKLRIAYQNGRLSVEDLRVTATRFEQTLGLH
ncbi:MAG: hypothetical protein HYY57_03435, partial [Candidatus Omnitrophica bacterium]|nr:hypothetical protein [Candidatus Omnitrophota bacterium]